MCTPGAGSVPPSTSALSRPAPRRPAARWSRGQGAIPIYQQNSAPTGYTTQEGESCYMSFTTDANKTIVNYDLLGGYCDKLFLSGG